MACTKLHCLNECKFIEIVHDNKEWKILRDLPGV